MQFQDSKDPWDFSTPAICPTSPHNAPDAPEANSKVASPLSPPKEKRHKIVNWDRVHLKWEIQTQGHAAACNCHECPSSSTPSPISSDMEDPAF